MTKGDGVMDEGRQSSITRVTRRSLRTSVQFGKELVGRFLVDLSFDSCVLVVRMFFE